MRCHVMHGQNNEESVRLVNEIQYLMYAMHHPDHE